MLLKLSPEEIKDIKTKMNSLSFDDFALANENLRSFYNFEKADFIEFSELLSDSSLFDFGAVDDEIIRIKKPNGLFRESQ